MTVSPSDEDLLHRFRAWEDIVAERNRQDAEWGSQREQSGYVWNAILTEEVGEASREVLEQDDDKLYKELVQVAAVTVAWLEALRAGRR